MSQNPADSDSQAGLWLTPWCGTCAAARGPFAWPQRKRPHAATPAARLTAMRTVLIAATAGALTLTGVGAAQASDDVTVMTRNVFLGADLGPALRATGGQEFVTAVGEIVRQVEATNFTKRAKGLAEEVQQRKPDLIGLQEVALWRKGKVNLNAVYNQQPSATKVHQDFLKILLKEINKGKATVRGGEDPGRVRLRSPCRRRQQPADGDLRRGGELPAHHARRHPQAQGRRHQDQGSARWRSTRRRTASPRQGRPTS